MYLFCWSFLIWQSFVVCQQRHKTERNCFRWCLIDSPIVSVFFHLFYSSSCELTFLTFHPLTLVPKLNVMLCETPAGWPEWRENWEGDKGNIEGSGGSALGTGHLVTGYWAGILLSCVYLGLWLCCGFYGEPCVVSTDGSVCLCVWACLLLLLWLCRYSIHVGIPRERGVCA